MSIEYVMWGLPAGSTERYDEVLLLSDASDPARVAKVKELAGKDGWHSFRVAAVDLSIRVAAVDLSKGVDWRKVVNAMTTAESNIDFGLGYTVQPARYAKGQIAVRPEVDGTGWKTVAAMIISQMPGVRWSNRERAYICSPFRAGKFAEEIAGIRAQRERNVGEAAETAD